MRQNRRGQPLADHIEHHPAPGRPVAVLALFFSILGSLLSVSKGVYDAGPELTLATSSTIVDELNRVLNRFLKWPLKAASGDATDPDGQTTDTCGTIIYTTSGSIPAPALCYFNWTAAVGAKRPARPCSNFLRNA